MKSNETKRENWEKTLQVAKFIWNSNLRTLAQGTEGLQILENTQNGGQKAGPFQSYTTKLAYLEMGN